MLSRRRRGATAATGSSMFLSQWSSRLGGGTEQVQRNVIGERVLGLPSDVRVDKDVPFRDLPAADVG